MNSLTKSSSKLEFSKSQKNRPFSEILDSIVYFVEKAVNGGICSILLANESNESLTVGSAPNLPIEFSQMINGIAICPSAFFNRPVLVSDIHNDSLWDGYKEMALENGLRCCWFAPIRDSQQKLLAVFSIFFDKPCFPTEEDLQLIEMAVRLTDMAIQHYQTEEKISFIASHDELTNLPNRRLFDEKVNNAIRDHTNVKDKMLGVMALDLDRFKLINDTLGHSIGDLLIQNAAQRLKSCLRETDTASRQGGDEFTILVNNVSEYEAAKIAERILEKLSKPYFIKGHEIFTTVSIGISLYPIDGQHSDDLLRKAEVAMYQAKKEGKNNYQFYDAKFDQMTYDRLELETELRKALEKNEFTLHYQPIINLSTNKISGVEALIRWPHPKLGYVSPNRFIPIAEETGMIVPIGEWVLETACRQLKQMQADGISMVSINISFRQFYEPNLVLIVKQIIKETGINPQNVTIEITESMTMDIETASAIITELKQLGVKISIDDFGTGYSSLSYLKKFPIDYLKIDQSFIRDINKSKYDKNIATTIIMMARNLGVQVIAEGVETIEQLEFLRHHRCNEAQGYLFSKPLSAEQLKRFLENNPSELEKSLLFDNRK